MCLSVLWCIAKRHRQDPEVHFEVNRNLGDSMIKTTGWSEQQRKVGHWEWQSADKDRQWQHIDWILSTPRDFLLYRINTPCSKGSCIKGHQHVLWKSWVFLGWLNENRVGLFTYKQVEERTGEQSFVLSTWQLKTTW